MEVNDCGRVLGRLVGCSYLPLSQDSIYEDINISEPESGKHATPWYKQISWPKPHGTLFYETLVV